MSREFFNRKAEAWDGMVNHDSSKISYVMEQLTDIDGAKILDVGSGTGILIPFLKERFGESAEITALDFAEKMIEVSKAKHSNYSNLNYIVGDISTYPLPEKNYDLIICYSVFPHFQDKEKILLRCSKLLKKNGSLVIFHSQSREEINNLHQNAGKEVKEDRLPPAHRVGEMAEKCGYIVKYSIDNEKMYLLKLIFC